MAIRKQITRFGLVAALAVLLSGCYAAASGYSDGDYGHSRPYVYSSHGMSSGHGYHEHGYYGQGHKSHGYKKHGHGHGGGHAKAAKPRPARHAAIRTESAAEPMAAPDVEGPGRTFTRTPTARDEGARPGADGGAR